MCTALDGKAIVVIDEAYIEWSGRASLAAWLERFSTPRGAAHLPRRTRWPARASARCSRTPELIELARRVIPPYSLAQPTIEAALRALEPDELAARPCAHRQRCSRSGNTCAARLQRSPLVDEVWPSDANFLLIDCRDADRFLRASMAGGTHRARPARNPALAALAAHLGGHARRERCA